MALSYRAVLITTVADPAAVVADTLKQTGLEYQQASATLAGAAAHRHRRGDDTGQVDVTVFTDDAQSVVTVDRSHPLAVGEVPDDTVPAEVPLLIASLAPSIGPFPAAEPITAEALLRALETAAPGLQTVVYVGSDSAAVPTAVENAFGELLAGMAAWAVVTPAEADQLRIQLQADRSFRTGSLIYVGVHDSVPEMELIPATVVSTQPGPSVRRFRSRCLRRLAQWALPGPYPELLGELARVGPATLDAEELLEELVLAETQNRQLTDDRDLAWLEQDEALRELNAARSRIRFLELHLQSLGDLGVGEVEDEEVEPDSCRDVIKYANEMLGFLSLGSLAGLVEELDRNPKSPVWAKKAWLGLRSLNDYAAARDEGRHQGDYFSYCNDPPPGAIPFFPNAVAPHESESTYNNPVTREARTFGVPTDVDPLGRVYMEAHLKLDSQAVAPRIHFFDDTGGRTKRIYIGYFGPHLPTGGS